MRERRNPLEWSLRPPYMDDKLGFPFEVGGGPISGLVTKWEAICLYYKGYLTICGPTGGASEGPIR
jgi:hypothetical protein